MSLKRIRTPSTRSARLKRGSSSLTPDPSHTPSKVKKIEPTSPSAQYPTKETLRDRKLKQHSRDSTDGPFPSFPRPTSAESRLAHQILASIHGDRLRPAEVVASKSRAGCGDSPSVLDALVRTILSQNTSDTNSTRAKLNMDKVYGGSDEWEAIASGGQARLEEAIRSGGLSQVKSKVIIKILDQAKEKYGSYTLDHLHSATTETAMEELLSFDGVGPKTASCVLLFCLGREDFAVDTHVHRITGLLGWRPKTSSREQTYHHLNKRIPDEHKYALHILLVTHGKRCDECKAGGRNTGKCELRKAFRETTKGAESMKEDPTEVDIKPVVKASKDRGAKLRQRAPSEPESMQDVKAEDDGLADSAAKPDGGIIGKVEGEKASNGVKLESDP